MKGCNIPTLVNLLRQTTLASKESDKLISAETYTRVASIPSVKVEKSLPRLVVLDLNGTLLYRTKSGRPVSRPYIKEFMNFIFNNGFFVMVWSSAQPSTVKRLVTAAFGKYEASLIEVWDRESFGLSKQQYYSKSLTIKDLEKVWEKLNDKAYNTSFPVVWDQSNTILIDDSTIKTQLQPFNSIHLMEYRASTANDHELLDVIPYLEKLRYQNNVSAYIKEFPHKSKN
ncbi:HAD-like protein [Gigaspora margarita]|uniref:Mitochondrial import inner membrane translocase subunit TIM50 n=1 Tax=Gigaspora margarita TaxID=4874 RepID=A0A8H3XC26_GIGMA|nr:HAD-like protein [Gigaspora margarita]